VAGMPWTEDVRGLDTGLTDGHCTSTGSHCLGTVNAIAPNVDIGRTIPIHTRDGARHATRVAFHKPCMHHATHRQRSCQALLRWIAGERSMGRESARPRNTPSAASSTDTSPCGGSNVYGRASVWHARPGERGLPHAPWTSILHGGCLRRPTGETDELNWPTTIAPHILEVRGKGPWQRTHGNSPHGMGCACCTGARAPSAWAAAPCAVSRAAARGGMSSTSSRRSSTSHRRGPMERR